jgi:hypothetical protein
MKTEPREDSRQQVNDEVDKYVTLTPWGEVPPTPSIDPAILRLGPTKSTLEAETDEQPDDAHAYLNLA